MLEIAPMEESASRLPDELEQLFHAHHRMVFRAACRITGSATDAEDVLQTVFLRLLARDPSAPPIKDAQSYLHRAAVNAALDLTRTRKDTLTAPPEPLPRNSPDRAHELRETLRRSLGNLPSQAAEVFALRFLEGYSNREIARMLGVSQVHVAVVIHRARRQLQKEIRSALGGRS